MRLLVLMLTFIMACASTSRSGVEARRCGKTKVQSRDLNQLSLKPTTGKITVVRVFATWCPYCKDDLAQISKRFKSGEWNEQNVEVLLLAYSNRREDQTSFKAWMHEDRPGFGFPEGAVRAVYSDKDAEGLRAVHGGDGESLFKEWQGIPYGLIFGKDGRLVFRGHFTMSPQFQDGHYQLITELSRETCD